MAKPKPRRRVSPRKTLTQEDVHRVLVVFLDKSKRHRRLAREITVGDVAALTETINGFITEPVSDAMVKELLRLDDNRRAYPAKVDDFDKLVNDILNYDRARNRAAEVFFQHIRGEMDELRVLLGEPDYPPHKGSFPQGHTLMGWRIARDVRDLLLWVGARYVARPQNGFGSTNTSPILIFTLAMLGLILPDKKLPSPRPLARSLERAEASFQVISEPLGLYRNSSEEV